MVGSEPASTSPPRSVLIIEDDLKLRTALRRNITSMGFDVLEAGGLTEGLDQLEGHDVDVALVDMHIPGGTGLDVMRSAPPRARDTEFVVITAYGNLDRAHACLEAGASAFLQKPVDMVELHETLSRSLQTVKLRKMLKMPAGHRDEAFLLGRSPAMTKLRADILRFANATASVMILGETGTGKELVAQALHAASERTGRFLGIDCNAFSETLIEGELFGWVKGGFTGATSDRTGMLAMAAGGTLLLDEIGDMPMTTQKKLLRAVESRQFFPVGGNQSVELSARLLGATHQDLDELVEKGEFREDLRHRLDVVTIRIPPLRERVDDIARLSWWFVREFNRTEGRNIETIDSEAITLLQAYQWPGNVRQLRNVLHNAVLCTDGPKLLPESLPDKVRQAAPTGEGARMQFPKRLREASYADARKEVLEEFIRWYCEGQLLMTGGNVRAAARRAGMQAPNFHRLLREHVRRREEDEPDDG